MTSRPTAAETQNRTRAAALPLAEFVALMALLTALTAMSIDIMLPALPDIGADLGFESENSRQLVLTFYMIGFAPAHLIHGPVSDRYGRRAPLFAGLAIYVAGTALAISANSTEMLLGARMLQGLGAAGPRVMVVSIVRDLYSGRDMARVMSFVMMVFIAVPVLAPAIGEGVLLLAGWRAIFIALFCVAVVAAVWAALRLPETMNPAYRIPLSLGGVRASARTFITTRQCIGYTLAMGFIFGVLMGYINSAQQIFVDVYDLGWRFPFVFGAIASFMILASLTNAMLVRQLGMRRVSHVALAGLLCVCGAMAAAGYPEKPPLLLFCGFVVSAFFCFGLIAPNFNALALEQAGPIAGMASAIVGFYSTAGGALCGTLVGQSFDGTVRPLTIGFTLCALLAFGVVLVTERFRFAQPGPRSEPEAG